MDFNLIQKTINKERINTISARELWRKLQSKQEFSHWIKNRLERFVENIDYIVVKEKAYVESNKINIDKIINIDKSTKKDNLRIDYFLTFDATKMICMLENNEIGDRIRRYFVDCEKELFSIKKERLLDIREKLNMTDKIQEIYGEKIESNKINGIKDWTYSNYTCLVYKKVFNCKNATEVRKKYNISEKENLRDSKKIPREKKDEIRDWEYSIHCYLQTLKKQNVEVDKLYNLVKNFLWPLKDFCGRN